MAARRIRTWLAAGAAALALGAPAMADTLADAMVGAYRTSGLLEQNRAVLRAADEDVAQAIAELRPVLNWTADITRQFQTSRSSQTLNTVQGSVTNSGSIGLSAQWLLFDFGRTRLGIDVAKESVLAARHGLVSVEQQVLLRAVQAFWEVRRAQQTVDLRQNNLRLIEQELQAARDRFEVGEVTRTDVALAEARLAETRSQLAIAQGNLVIAIEEYLGAVGRRPGDLVVPRTVPSVPATVDQATQTALRLHPDIIAQQHAVTVAELSIKIAEAAMKPTVSLGGTLGYTRNLDDSDVFSRSGSVGIEASGPIYQGGALSSLVRQSMARRDQERAVLLTTTRQVRQNVANAYVQLQVARSSISSGNNQVSAAQVAFDGVREEATLGARTTLDVLDAEQDLLDARTLLISAQVDEYIAAYTVIASMGLLTVEQLDLPVQRYDPSVYYNLVKDAPTLSSQGEDLDRVLRALGKQ
ncbi:TolC family outer membrane protein [Roseivivax isoporae]|uniref:Protein CyaE n=1 Tax=Roseivivax isoporae LMG 25204 TaxID=1449351 RepID=X7F7J9_9RHOB|nr:TolC family outer membrane protein [Roseivivax isoporae]ETX28795.1 transporter [Roseivivax isoporae LMG 25204]